MSNFTKTALAIIVIAIILVIGYQMMNPSDDVMSQDQGTNEMAPADEAAPAASDEGAASSDESMMDQAGDAAEATGEAVKEGAEDAMDATEDAAKATGDAIEEGAEDANEAMGAKGMDESEEPSGTEAPKTDTQPAQ